MFEANQSSRTLVVLKPNVAERNLIGTVIKAFEKGALKVVAMDMRRVFPDLIAKHYPDSMAETLGRKSERAGEKIDNYVEQGMRVLQWNRNYLTRGPVIAILLEGENAIKRVREVTGSTDPTAADKGTIRGDLGIDSILKANRESRAVENLIHASGSAEEAKAEIELWFGPDEVCRR